MSEKMTIIRLPLNTASPEWADFGEHTGDDMISQIRKRAAEVRIQCEAIENAEDHEFQIDIIRLGIFKRHVKEIQKSSRTA